MWEPSQDEIGGVGADDVLCYDRPSQRRRWDAFSDPKLLLEYSPPRSSRLDASTQVSSEHRQRPTLRLESKGTSPAPSRWDVSTQVPSELKSRIPSHVGDLQSSVSQPARLVGGNSCNCCPCPAPEEKKCPVSEGHLPMGYRRFVEHDDLYLPPSRALSPASADHDDLYLPLRTNDNSPGECCPCDLRMCSDPRYGDIYLPPPRPCISAYPKDSSGCPPPCRPCSPCPPRPSSPPGKPSFVPKIVCSCPPYIKTLAPCPAPPASDCSFSPSGKKPSGDCSAGPPRSSRCQECGSCSTKGGGSPVVSPKLFDDPCCSPCRPAPSCRPLLAAEMLSGMEACVTRAKACGTSTACCMDPRCGSAPSTPPCSPVRSPEPPCSSFGDDVHNPVFKNFESSSPRCKDCDCHRPKNCKLSLQICKFCRGSGWCYCEHHTTMQLLTDCKSQRPTSPRSPRHDKKCMTVEEPVACQVLATSPKGTYRSLDFSTRSAKAEFNRSPCDEETGQIPRSPMCDPSPPSDITQVCCCGKCMYSKPRYPIKIKCPFCKHTHSCCCGMCACPISSCTSKSTFVFPPPRNVIANTGGVSTGWSITPFQTQRPKSVAPRKKPGLTSPDKSASRAFATSNSQASNSRLRCRSSSPKTRIRHSPLRR